MTRRQIATALALAASLALAAAFVFVGGCSGEAGPPEPGNAERGAAVYALYCAACHQPDGGGMPSSGVRLAADLAAPGGPLAKTDEELLNTIRNGRTGTIGAMPPWKGILSAQQQRDVLAHLRARFVPPPPPQEG